MVLWRSDVMARMRPLSSSILSLFQSEAPIQSCRRPDSYYRLGLDLLSMAVLKRLSFTTFFGQVSYITIVRQLPLTSVFGQLSFPSVFGHLSRTSGCDALYSAADEAPANKDVAL